MTVYRYDFSILGLHILDLDAGQGSASDQIMTRNTVILAVYMGITTIVEAGSQESADSFSPILNLPSHVHSGSFPPEITRDHLAAFQSPLEVDETTSMVKCIR